jgi:hypothetical protein
MLSTVLLAEYKKIDDTTMQLLGRTDMANIFFVMFCFNDFIYNMKNGIRQMVSIRNAISAKDGNGL